MRSISSVANVRDRRRRSRAQDHRHAIGLRLPFEARGEVHGVAKHRIVEAQIGAHVADDAGPVLRPMPIFMRQERLAAASASARAAFSARSPQQRSAASQACTSWAGSSSGAFQNAMMASPMYLSMVPCVDDGVGQRRQEAGSSGSLGPGGFLVDLCDSGEPRTSLNRMVITRSSPPRTSFPGI